MIEHDELCRMIPHDGSMCLLGRVLEWDSQSIVCEVDSHRDRNNPLSSDGRLSSVMAIEYAAQALAVHGRLSGGSISHGQTSYLAAVREVEFYVDWLQDIQQTLTIKAQRLMTGDTGMIYQFRLYASSQCLLQGRVTVMLSSDKE